MKRSKNNQLCYIEQSPINHRVDKMNRVKELLIKIKPIEEAILNNPANNAWALNHHHLMIISVFQDDQDKSERDYSLYIKVEDKWIEALEACSSLEDYYFIAMTLVQSHNTGLSEKEEKVLPEEPNPDAMYAGEDDFNEEGFARNAIREHLLYGDEFNVKMTIRLSSGAKFVKEFDWEIPEERPSLEMLSQKGENIQKERLLLKQVKPVQQSQVKTPPPVPRF